MIKTLLALTVLTLCAACKKEEPSRSELLTGSWRRSFQAVDTNRNQMLDVDERKAITDTMLLGAVYTFNANGSGTIVGSGLTTNFTWALTHSDQQLAFTIPNAGTDTSYIHTLTANELILEHRYTAAYYWNGLRK